MNRLICSKLLTPSLLLTILQGLPLAFILSSIKLEPNGSDNHQKFTYLAFSFTLSTLANFLSKASNFSDETILLISFISIISFNSASAFFWQSSWSFQCGHFLPFYRIRIPLTLLVNLLSSAFLSYSILSLRRRISSGMIYTETGGIFLYIARNFPHLLHESYVLFVASSVPTFVFLLFSLLFFIPLLNILRFIIPIDIFYSSTIELIADIVLISMSNWIYCLFIGILALLFIYNSSVIPFDGCYSQSSLFSKGRLLLHRHFTMVSFSSDRRLSEYIELEFLEAHTILDSIQSAAVKLENSRFLNIPQINRNGGTKIRNYDIVAYFRSLWNYYLTIYTLSFRYHEIAFSLCRILSYFAKVQNYATRCDADLLKVPTLFESLLERERFIEKYCQINLESNEHAEHFKRSVKLF